MAAQLFCKTGELAGLTYLINREATIGRLEENQIALHPSYISGHHARIYFDDNEGRYFLEDLNSSNGTWLDGTRIAEPIRLDRLHVITFSSQVDFIFHVLAQPAPLDIDTPVKKPTVGEDTEERTHIGHVFPPLPSLPDLAADASGEVTRLRDPFADMKLEEEAQASGEKTTFHDAFSLMPSLPEPPAQPPSDATLSPSPPTPKTSDHEEATPLPATTPAPFVLVVTMPDHTVKEFSLREGPQIIGRERSCDLTIPDSSISRRHARITVDAGTVTLEDLKSKNATFIDGQKLQEAVEVHPENILRFGLTIEASLKHP